MQNSAIEILDIINQNQRSRVIEIFYEAFKQKIRALIKSRDKALALYNEALTGDRIFCALLDGNIVGIIGLQYKGKNFIDLKYRDIRKYFNPFISYFFYFINKLTLPKIRDDILRIDSVAVDESLRSKGIGTQLINKVFEFARDNGFKEVILEVVNTNPKAKTLYEKIGFKQKKIVRYYFLARRAGFSFTYVMSYEL